MNILQFTRPALEAVDLESAEVRGPWAPRVRPRKRVWIVDDSRLSMEAAARLLAPDYEVELFGDGAEVLESAASGLLPDVLLLDWNMPGISGGEVLRFLRSSPRTSALPILVLTSSADDRDLVESLSCGANDYVVKPCARPELVARVASLVRTKELRERAENAEREIADLLVRERAARADAESANQVKDDFLATLSHELRTPLNAIMGWVGLLRGGTLSPVVANRALETIERNASAQAAMIEDLLDVSRIVNGNLRLELADLDIADTVEQAVETQRPLAARKKVKLTARIARVGLISGDAARIEQIVGNLLSNAIRFTPAAGSIVVDVERAGDRVMLRVCDTGEGISRELLPGMFDRFKQGDSSSTRRHGGLGLGLAIVRHLAELHGGSVRASSDGAGLGATLEVSLPLATRRSEAARAAAPAFAPGRLDGLSVLVVDDDGDALELLSVALSSRGATVSAASSAALALTHLETSPHAVLVSDIMMPEVDGYSLIRAIRDGGGGPRASIPAIAVTAAARDVDSQRALDAGFDVHMSKPVDIERLVANIARLDAAARASRT